MLSGRARRIPLNFKLMWGRWAIVKMLVRNYRKFYTSPLELKSETEGFVNGQYNGRYCTNEARLVEEEEGKCERNLPYSTEKLQHADALCTTGDWLNSNPLVIAGIRADILILALEISRIATVESSSDE